MNVTGRKLSLLVLLSTLTLLLVAQPAARPNPAQQQSPSTPSLLDSVSLIVSVTDNRGRAITGLDQSAFAITDERGREQQITSFSDADQPLSVAILLDTSGSMEGGAKHTAIREGLARFLFQGHHLNEYFLMGFSKQPELLVDWVHDSDAILNHLSSITPHGPTALYDACFKAVEKVVGGKYPKHVLILFSDGEDSISNHTFSELQKLLKKSDVQLYAVSIESRDPASTLDAEGEGILTELTSITGGRAYFPSSKSEMIEVSDRTAVELHYQYSISFKPSQAFADGKWHKVKVKATMPPFPKHVDVNVRSRGGYFAPASTH